MKRMLYAILHLGFAGPVIILALALSPVYIIERICYRIGRRAVIRFAAAVRGLDPPIPIEPGHPSRHNRRVRP